MSEREKITPATIKFPHDGAPPEGSTGRSLINEVDQLKKAVLPSLRCSTRDDDEVGHGSQQLHYGVE